ncbi:MAG: trypsin-like serine protease [bacterium]|nr:trypsin-like serine protease [bacterium]
MKVILGASNRRRPKEQIWASRGFWHARYNFPDNDIALLKLSKASKQRVTSYNASALLDGKRAKVAGWGLYDCPATIKTTIRVRFGYIARSK